MTQKRTTIALDNALWLKLRRLQEKGEIRSFQDVWDRAVPLLIEKIEKGEVKMETSITDIVAAALRGANETYLQEIIDHGIHNVTNDFQGETDEEYEEFTQEFDRQARKMLESEVEP
jgi:type VI protein secretion system component Hcp